MGGYGAAGTVAADATELAAEEAADADVAAEAAAAADVDVPELLRGWFIAAD
jgi:hypothetical protein